MPDWDMRIGLVCAAIVALAFLFTSGQCSQNYSARRAERFTACINAGGSWISDNCIVKQP